jgi:hypothetical protein
MITYKAETRDYSNWPYWYRAYGVAYSDFKRSAHPLKLKRNEIKQWFKEGKIDATVDKNGFNYRFYREADRTMFLLRWA